MIALRVLDVKQFMGKLFYQTIFDSFYVKEVSIRTFFNISMNGSRNIEYYPLEEQEIKKQIPKVLWEEMKGFVFQLIKGTRTPLFLQIVLQLSEEQTEKITKLCSQAINSQESIGLYFNLRFENGKLILTTGVSRTSFTLDKTLDRILEEYVINFLKEEEIGVEQEV